MNYYKTYYKREYSNLDLYFYDNKSIKLENFDWASISKHSSDMKGLDRHQRLINWISLSNNKHLTVWFVEKNKQKIHWSIFSRICSLAILEDKQLENYIDFWFASWNKNLSIELIRVHQNEINWKELRKWASWDILDEFRDEF